MEVSDEFAKLFPKTTWTDEEIAEAMFTPEEESLTHHSADKGFFQIDVTIEEYAKQHTLVDLNEFLNTFKDTIASHANI